MRLDDLNDGDIITVRRLVPQDALGEEMAIETHEISFADLRAQLYNEIENKLCERYYMNRNNY